MTIHIGAMPRAVARYRAMAARDRSRPAKNDDDDGVAAVDQFIQSAAVPRASQPPKVNYTGSDGREMQRPGLLGIAALFGQTFLYNGEPTQFMAGAFTGAPNVRLLFDHDDGLEVGSVEATGLQLAADDEALYFRMPLARSETHGTAASLVKSGARSCVSVGGTVVKSEKRWVDSQRVTVIHEFTLKEISMCAQGRVVDTWAEHVDLADYPATMQETVAGTSFAGMGAAQRILASGRRIGWLLNGEMTPEKARPDTQAVPAWKHIKHQTEQTEVLQRHAQARAASRF